MTMISVADWLREPIVYFGAWWVLTAILVTLIAWYALHGGHWTHKER
jgi:hypothetical protein